MSSTWTTQKPIAHSHSQPLTCVDGQYLLLGHAPCTLKGFMYMRSALYYTKVTMHAQWNNDKCTFFAW